HDQILTRSYRGIAGKHEGNRVHPPLPPTGKQQNIGKLRFLQKCWCFEARGMFMEAASSYSADAAPPAQATPRPPVKDYGAPAAPAVPSPATKPGKGAPCPFHLRCCIS